MDGWMGGYYREFHMDLWAISLCLSRCLKFVSPSPCLGGHWVPSFPPWQTAIEGCGVELLESEPGGEPKCWQCLGCLSSARS
jgi:hypothetical protein